MFNVDLTGSFAGAFPSTILVPAAKHSAAVRFYKKALRAKQIASGSSKGCTVLESALGFRFRVDARSGGSSSSSSSSSRFSVRLSLPPRSDRATVARALASGGYVSHQRSGLVVTDPFMVTWTLAWQRPSEFYLRKSLVYFWASPEAEKVHKGQH